MEKLLAFGSLRFASGVLRKFGAGEVGMDMEIDRLVHTFYRLMDEETKVVERQ